MDHLYHWKHGWIPLDHHAALQKAKGNHAAALKMLSDAGRDGGIHNRSDVAKAILDMHNVHPDHRAEPMAEVVHAAEKHGNSDIVPPAYKRRASGTRARLRNEFRLAQHAQDLRAEQATGGYKRELGNYFGGKNAPSTSVSESRINLERADEAARREVTAEQEAAHAWRLEQKKRKAADLALTKFAAAIGTPREAAAKAAFERATEAAGARY